MSELKSVDCDKMDYGWRRDVELRLSKLETDGAVDAERYSGIIRRLEKIESILSNLVWLVITIVVAGILKFILDGGLNLPSV
jgi:hypothetical protein